MVIAELDENEVTNKWEILLKIKTILWNDH